MIFPMLHLSNNLKEKKRKEKKKKRKRKEI